MPDKAMRWVIADTTQADQPAVRDRRGLHEGHLRILRRACSDQTRRDRSASATRAAALLQMKGEA